VLWFVLQIPVLLFLRGSFESWNASDGLYFNSSVVPATLWLSQLGWIVLAVFLGRLFNFKIKSNWMRNLPFSAATWSIFGQLILIGYCFSYYLLNQNLFNLIFINNHLSGLSFLICFSLSVFYICRAVQGFGVALFLSGLSCVLLFGSAVLPFHRLLIAHTESFSELLFFGFTFLLICAFERRNPKTFLPALILLGLVFAGPLAYRTLRLPTDLNTIVTDVTLASTDLAKSRFQQYVLSDHIWARSAGGLSKYDHVVTLHISDLVHHRFNDTQKNQLIQLELDHPDAFILRDKRGVVSGYSFPLYLKSDDTAQIEYLLQNWKDDAAHCILLPRTADQRVFERLTSSQCDGERNSFWIYETLLFHYLPARHGPYEQFVDGLLLWADHLKIKERRDSIVDPMNYVAGWRVRSNMRARPAPIDLSKEHLTQQNFATWKGDFLKNYRNDIDAWSGLPRSEFIRTIKSLKSDPESLRDLEPELEYLYNLTTDTYDSRLISQPRPIAIDLMDYFKVIYQPGIGRLLALEQAILSDELWPKIQALHGHMVE